MVDVVLALLAGLVLVLGILSRLLKRNALSPALLALLVGVLVGPALLGWVDLTRVVPRAVLLEQVTRFTLAVAVADIGLQTTRDDLRRNAGRIAVLLTVGMLGMWLVTATGAWLLLGLPLVVALRLGALLTPTDPAVAAGLVSGALPDRLLPRGLRRSLQLESGANDGLALPLVLLAGLLATEPAATAVPHWLGETGRELALALAIGPSSAGCPGAWRGGPPGASSSPRGSCPCSVSAPPCSPSRGCTCSAAAASWRPSWPA